MFGCKTPFPSCHRTRGKREGVTGREGKERVPAMWKKRRVKKRRGTVQAATNHEDEEAGLDEEGR
jgi:hypothetical protein